jgi:TIGR03009 family protein
MNDATSSVSNGNIPISAQPVSSDPNITRSVSIPVTNVVPGTVPVQPFYATQPLPPIQPNQPTPPPAPREPFTLTAAQEQELDAFLDRWEQHSLKIQRLEMSFLKYYFHDTTREQQTPTYITQGSFNYIKPDRVLYSIEGAFDQTTRKVDNSKYQEKWLYDGRSIHEYNFNVKEVVETPLPPEYRGKGIADSPLPMIFGAKKDEMKRRYWMRLVTEPKYANEQIWIEIYPRWRDDALEFRSLEMRVNNQTLVPIGFRKYDTGIARNDYAFFDVKINSGLDKLIDVMTKLFKSDVPQGWKHVVRELNEPTASLIATPTQPAPSQPNPQVVNEYKPSQPPQQIDLYDPEAKRTQPIYR